MVVGISTDSLESHNRFRDSNSLPFPLVSDPDKRIMGLYDVRRRLDLGTSRITYLIGKDGVIRGVFHHELRISRHIQDVLKGLHVLEPVKPM